MTLLNQQLQSQVIAFQNNSTQTGGELENNISPNLLTLDESIQKRIVEAKSLDHPNPITKINDSLLRRDPKCKFPRKFLTPTFDYYFKVSDSVQHIRHVRDKMVIYSRKDLIMCLTFPSILKGATSDWFYSLPPRSLHNFTEVTEAFVT